MLSLLAVPRFYRMLQSLVLETLALVLVTGATAAMLRHRVQVWMIVLFHIVRMRAMHLLQNGPVDSQTGEVVDSA